MKLYNQTTKVRIDVAAEVNAKQLQYHHLTDEEQSVRINEIFNFESEVLIRSVMDYIQENFDEIQKRLFQMLKRRFRNLAKK
ncbi:hypothetical protein [Bacillus stercoris]|uniref:hypothetical protein n=1 Tax=Bacillus stercoris TaxID=2054641 RepID=UPI001FB44035|nr:hypothetical protein [Bacillus stercoris]